jgi:hypothetical protein
VLAPHIVYGRVHQSDEERRRLLRAFADRLRAIERESPIEIGRY